MAGPVPIRGWLRFFRSELRLVFGRRRNLWILAVTGAFPVLIGVGLRLATHQGNSGGPDGVAFIGQLAGNGVFLSFIALTLLLTLVMPLAVGVAAGDYAAIVVFAVAVTFGVAGCALATGAALFPIGPVTLLSGTTVPLADGIVRLLLVALYVTAAMASFGAMGLAFSSLTEHSLGAVAALVILVVVSEVTDNVPQFAAIHPYLPTHWWNSFDALLRVPVDTGTLWRGLLSFGIYGLLWGSIAWARFSTADVTS
jgi:hypothetical protein